MTSVMFSPWNAEGKAMKNYGKLIVGGFAIMAAYSAVPVHGAPGAEPKPATAATQAYLEQFSASLPFADREDFELATRGFVAAIPGNRILDAQGKLLHDLNVEGFFSQPVPLTVNPSLWRNAGLVAKSGLFKVSDRVYQVRGVDNANMTIVLGDTGFVVIDTLTIAEAAKASVDLAREKLGNRPIMGVVHTHPHRPLRWHQGDSGRAGSSRSTRAYSGAARIYGHDRL